MENIVLIVLGVALCILGVLNIKGDIRSIHRYNRSKVKEEDKKKYGMFVGVGTSLCGLAMFIEYISIIYLGHLDLLVIAIVILGIILIIIGQLKYNKGLF